MTEKPNSANDRLTIEVPLKNGGVTIIDSEDLSKISGKNWFQHKGYAIYGTTKAGGKREAGRLHRLIMNAPKGVIVDHINGDRLVGEGI